MLLTYNNILLLTRNAVYLFNFICYCFVNDGDKNVQLCSVFIKFGNCSPSSFIATITTNSAQDNNASPTVRRCVVRCNAMASPQANFLCTTTYNIWPKKSQQISQCNALYRAKITMQMILLSCDRLWLFFHPNLLTPLFYANSSHRGWFAPPLIRYPINVKNNSNGVQKKPWPVVSTAPSQELPFSSLPLPL